MGGRTGNNHWSEERWERLTKRLCADFGPASAAKIIESIVYEIGGERVTIPNLQDLQRRERDRKICNLHTGDNTSELAVRFSLHENSIRRILLSQRFRQRD